MWGSYYTSQSSYHPFLNNLLLLRSSRQSSAANAWQHGGVPSCSVDQPGEADGPDLRRLQTGQVFWKQRRKANLV